jgi:16S rRNA (guanine527-N7)-methyltransferase
MDEMTVPVERQAETAMDSPGWWAFGAKAGVTDEIDEDTITVRIDGADLDARRAKGATLNAIEELVGTVVQRETGGHGARITWTSPATGQAWAALEDFPASSREVLETGDEQALESMGTTGPQVVHDTVSEIDGVETTSEGEDPPVRGDPPGLRWTSGGSCSGYSRGAGSRPRQAGPLQAHVDHSRAWAAALGSPRRPRPGSGAVCPDSCWRSVAGGAGDVARRPPARRGLDQEAAAPWGWPTGSWRSGRPKRRRAGPELREAFPLVVARGFAAPAVTAECGAAFVAPGGRLSVSEPPGPDPARWPPEQLAVLQLGPASTISEGEATFATLEKTGRLDDRWPRQVGQPAIALWS